MGPKVRIHDILDFEAATLVSTKTKAILRLPLQFHPVATENAD